MNPVSQDELLFFDRFPSLLPIYLKLRKEILGEFPETEIRVSRTQISFYAGYMFAMASLPVRRRKEACPGRWTHHVPVETPEEVDEELFTLLRDAHAFALQKGRKTSQKRPKNG